MEKVVKYWKQEEGYDCIWNANCFCAYSIGDGEFFIAHFYVKHRKGGAAKKFFEEVKLVAKSLGCDRLTGVLHLNDANAENYTHKLMIQLRHGYKILSVDTNRITVIYELT